MTLARRHFLHLAGFAAAAPAASRLAFGQAYPSRPVRWIVPYPAGGTTDLIARLMGQWLTERLGKPVVIENKPGGGTNIGVQAVVNAPPDGYTLLFTVATNAINPSLYKSLPFDFQRDIAPVAGLAELPLVMVVNPGVPANTLAEFIAHAKANPGKVNVASFGVRTISHLALELFKASTGVDVVHVPYPGGATMMTDLISGRIEAGIDALPNSLPHIKGGGVRALAILPAARTAALPQLPTIGETISGLRGQHLVGRRRSAEARRPKSSSGSTARSTRGWRTPPSRRASPRSAPCRCASPPPKWARASRATSRNGRRWSSSQA